MITAPGYDGLWGTGYAIISPDPRLSRFAQGERQLGTAFPNPIVNTGTYLSMLFDHGLFTGSPGTEHELERLAIEASDRVHTLAPRDERPEDVSWKARAQRYGSFGLLAVELSTRPTLYVIEATRDDERVNRFGADYGGIFCSEEFLIQAGPATTDTITLIHGRIDDDGLHGLVHESEPFKDLNLTLAYATDQGALIDRVTRD